MEWDEMPISVLASASFRTVSISKKLVADDDDEEEEEEDGTGQGLFEESRSPSLDSHLLGSELSLRFFFTALAHHKKCKNPKIHSDTSGQPRHATLSTKNHACSPARCRVTAPISLMARKNGREKHFCHTSGAEQDGM